MMQNTETWTDKMRVYFLSLAMPLLAVLLSEIGY